VRCLLLRERAEAKRRGELEQMRNEQNNDGHGDGQSGLEIRIEVRGSRQEMGGTVDTVAVLLSRATEPQRNVIPLLGIILYSSLLGSRSKNEQERDSDDTNRSDER